MSSSTDKILDAIGSPWNLGTKEDSSFAIALNIMKPLPIVKSIEK